MAGEFNARINVQYVSTNPSSSDGPSRNRPGVRLPPRADCWSAGARLVHALCAAEIEIHSHCTSRCLMICLKVISLEFNPKPNDVTAGSINREPALDKLLWNLFILKG